MKLLSSADKAGSPLSVFDVWAWAWAWVRRNAGCQSSCFGFCVLPSRKVQNGSEKF